MSRNPRIAAARCRGSAMLIAAGVIVIILLLGLAFLNTSSSNRIAANAGSRSNYTQNAIDQTITYLGDVIAKDWVQHLNPALAVAPDISTEGEDYPGPNDPWLACIEPSDSDLNGLWDDYLQVTLLDLTNGFINATTLANVEAGPPFDQTLTPIPLSGQYNDTIGDANGDGLADGKWIRLPVTSPDGTVWIAVIYIIDNSGLVNVNTATNTPFNPNPVDVLGSTPADIDMHWLLANTVDTSPPWSSSFTATNVTTQWPNFFAKLGYAHPAVPADDTERQSVWATTGAWTGRRIGVTFGGDPAVPVMNSFGWTDEAELRLKASHNTTARTALEDAIDGAAQGPVRSYDDAFPSNTNDWAAAAKADRRRLLTVFNATRQQDVIPALGYYRQPMPLWIQNAGSLPIPNDPDGNSVGIPAYRLNPNTTTPLVLAQLFSDLLNQNPIDADRYEGSTTRATEAAYALAANLAAYRNTEIYDVAPSQVTGTSYYGVERQPFITEVVTAHVYKDRDNTTDSSTDDMMIQFADEYQHSVIAIEIQNPWSEAIDLSKYAIALDGDVNTAIQLSGTLQPGDVVVICSDNDPQWATAIQTTNPSLAGKIITLLGLTYSTANPTAIITLYTVPASGTGVLVDRMRSGADWPAVALTTDTPVTNEEDYLITSSTLKREWDGLAPASAGAIGPMPAYVYENPTKSGVPDVDYADSLQNVPGTFGFAKTSTPSVGSIPVTQLATKNTNLDTIGELLNLFTVSHFFTGIDNTSTTFSEAMFTRFTAEASTPPTLAIASTKLNFLDFPRNSAPIIPVAMTIFDALDMVSDTVPPTSERILCGMINVNTAPTSVLQTLPYLSDASLQVAEGIVVFRDTVAGFQSIGKLLEFRSFGPSANISVLADPIGPYANNTAGAPDFSNDTVPDDLEEDTLLFQRISNLVTLRSDVFTAYVLLQGRKKDSGGNWVPAVQKRFVVTIDRSNVDNSGNPGTTAPRVLMYAEAE